ncbi:unnamed protein product [Malus baccata var. baccata]
MENGKLTRFTYGGLCVVSSISSSSTFNQICIDLCSKFKGLRVGCFELRYGLNENPNCVSDCDADVLNMLMVLDVVGKSIVEILVIDKCDGSIIQLPTESTSSSCCTLDSMIVSSENDHLGKGGCVDFRDKLKKFSVECGFDLKYLKNDKNRISAECSKKESDGCLWTVFELNGDDVDAYKFLSWYVESARSSNSGSVFELENMSTLFPKAVGEGLKKKMMNLLANCAYACTPSDFDDCMAEFKDNGQEHVKNFLCDLPKENYVIAHFPGKRWGSMSNALSESFNAMVSNSQCMPLMDLLEDIRVRLMGSMTEKRIFDQNIHTILCPKKENEMKLMLKEGMHWRISRFDADVFEVRTEWNRFVVLQHDNRDVFYYVDDYWKTSFYRNTYQFVMHPFSDLEKSNVDTIINGVRPPITKIPSGRPKKTRIKSAGEISGSKKTVTCSRCGRSGHNKEASSRKNQQSELIFSRPVFIAAGQYKTSCTLEVVSNSHCCLCDLLLEGHPVVKKAHLLNPVLILISYNSKNQVVHPPLDLPWLKHLDLFNPLVVQSKYFNDVFTCYCFWLMISEFELLLLGVIALYDLDQIYTRLLFSVRCNNFIIHVELDQTPK